MKHLSTEAYRIYCIVYRAAIRMELSQQDARKMANLAQAIYEETE